VCSKSTPLRCNRIERIESHFAASLPPLSNAVEFDGVSMEFDSLSMMLNARSPQQRDDDISFVVLLLL